MDDPDRFTWKFRQKYIRSHIDTPGGLSCFLTWPVATEALYFMNWQVADRQLEILSQSPLFPSYDRAMRPFHAGGAVREQGRKYDPHLVLQAYHLDRVLRSGLVLYDVKSVYEFGPGFGGMTLVLNRMGFRGNYIMQDLPELNRLQSYFLQQERVSNGYPVSHIVDGHYSLFIANCSLDEVSEVDRLECWDAIDADYYEICYHQSWDEVDMNEVMADLAEMKPDVDWEQHEDEIYSPQAYMIGRRR